MPTAITHQLLAEEVYGSLPAPWRAEVFSLPHFYFGAQGCDICFAYKVLSTASGNFGRFLHANFPLLFFRILSEEAAKSREVRSYALGYLTHYAADTVFHPYIYGLMEEESRYFHHAIEHAVDGALLQKLRGRGLLFYSLPRPDGIAVEGVYNVYARYARESGWGEPEEEAFRKAVRRYYAFSALRTPFYRAGYAVRAEELFETSRQRSLRLIGIFLTRKGEDFSPEDFGRHYLTGKIL